MAAVSPGARDYLKDTGIFAWGKIGIIILAAALLPAFPWLCFLLHRR